jgi:hypothetical protein
MLTASARTRRRTASLTLLLLAATGCASSAAGSDDDGGDDTPPPPIDAAEAPPDAPRVVPDASTENKVYVSVLGSDGNSGRSPDQPLRHLRLAIEKAAACAPLCEVVIAEGTYEESITLAAGVHVSGGFTNDFTSRDARIYPVAITSDQPRTVIADGLDVATALDGVTIRGADYRQDIDGASTYGLWVRASGDFLTLRRVNVEGGRAGRGRDGENGSLQACDAPGGSGAEAYDCGANGGALGSSGGDPTFGGEGGGGGSSYCVNACPAVNGDGISDGEDGKNGGKGRDGVEGAAANDADGGFEGDLWVGAAGTSGERGLHGTGGGGAGSGGTKRIRACFGCGSLIGGRGGDGGRGGCGGNGGESGGAGGGSFAVVIIGSTVKAEQVAITGGVGGASVGVALVNGGQLAPGEPGSVGIQVGSGGAGGAGGSGTATAASGLVGAAADIVIY